MKLTPATTLLPTTTTTKTLLPSAALNVTSFPFRLRAAARSPAAAPAVLPFAVREGGRRFYAAQHNAPGSDARRRAVTPFNDDGHIPWRNLSAGEKAGRAAQQTFNFGLVALGVVLTGGVFYFLYQDVFSPDSKVAFFNRAVDRIKKDPRCLELLGEGKKITAFGEETHNKWRRARPIASTVSKDSRGNEHLMMHFNVQGPKGKGTVGMHLIRRNGQGEYAYKYLFVDVKGHQRIYLENADAAAAKGNERKEFKLFGVKWS